MVPDRFVCESALDEVARRLRVLGFDVRTHRGARLEDLLADARRDDATVLTTSHRHPRRWRDVRVCVVPTTDVAAAVRTVADAFTPASDPFMRCSLCNTALAWRLAFEARGEVPGRVLRTSSHFTYCPGCGKWYWEGSHVRRLRDWLSATLGRPVPGPIPPSGPPG